MARSCDLRSRDHSIQIKELGVTDFQATDYIFIHQRRVAFHESDAAGIVHFANFFRYVEEAEQALWRQQGTALLTITDQHWQGWPKVQAHAIYKHPAQVDDELSVALLLNARSQRSLQWEWHIWRADMLLAAGLLNTVCVTKDQHGRIGSAAIPSEALALPISNSHKQRYQQLIEEHHGGKA